MSDERRPPPVRKETERRKSADRRGGDRRATTVRVAAVGDIHVGEKDTGLYRELFSCVNEDADVLLLAGDLTRRGTPAEAHVVLNELLDVRIPILAVLGNHDHESGQVEALENILRERSIHLLGDGPYELNDRVGFAGTKGFMGGFGRYTLTAFGEADTKTFVGRTLEEVQNLEFSLRRLSTPVRVVLLHYAPVRDTVEGEPEPILPFLGNDRLAEPIDRFGAAVAFHGHAHHGAFRGATPGGVPVFNVLLHQVRESAGRAMYYVHEIPLPPEADGGNGDGTEAAAGARAGAEVARDSI
jgi:uncharacterized protein